MEIGTAWSLIEGGETSSLPEAVWHQSTSTETPGFFVSLLQRWDISSDEKDFKSVFYKVEPFLRAAASDTAQFPIFSLRLPTQLAVVDCDSQQERRVPLLVRFSENKRILAMQFSPTMVRIAVPEMEGQPHLFAKCSHWTVDLANKIPYTPVPSSPETLPSTVSTSASSEVILPGAGLFWLDLSCGRNARGEDYQEHMIAIVTTKSLLCYTVTLDSLNKSKTTVSMKLSHHFSHNQASAAWWHPNSFALVVAFYQTVKLNQPLMLQTYFFAKGPFASRREVLQNPLLLPLRLERPPPVRCPAFPATLPTTDTPTNMAPSDQINSAESQSLSKSEVSSTSARQKNHKLSTRCVAPVSLYGRSYIAVIRGETFTNGAGKHLVDVYLHELDPENCTVAIGRHHQQVTLPKKIRSSKEDVLLTVLDDLLCVSFRKSKLQLFLDIRDVGSDCAYVVEKMTSDSEQTYLLPSIQATFVAPSYLFLPKAGLVLPLAIDLERLAPSVAKHDRCNFSMLLRRRSGLQYGRQIALSRFSTIGALAQPEQRWKWIDHIASAYASYAAENGTKTTPLQWDLQSTLPLIFHCALLPKDCEFLPICEATTPQEFQLSLQMCAPVLHQKEVITDLFLSKTKQIMQHSAKPSEETVLVLDRISELVVSYIGALEKHGSCPCPSLHVFAFALLWRLGNNPLINALLKYRTWTFACSQPHLASNFLGTKWHVSVLTAIVQLVQFGCWRSEMEKDQKASVTLLRRRMVNLTTSLLSSANDYRLAAEQILQLLFHGRLLDAVSVALHVFDRAEDPQTTSCKARAALVYARRINTGADFLNAAVGSWRILTLEGQVSSWNRQVYLLHSFLVKWDPECLHMMLRRGVAVGSQPVRDDLHLVPKVTRRPTLISCSVVAPSLKVSGASHHNHVGSDRLASLSALNDYLKQCNFLQHNRNEI